MIIWVNAKGQITEPPDLGPIPEDAYIYRDDEGYEFIVTPSGPEPPPHDPETCGGCMGCHMCPSCGRLEGEGHSRRCPDGD